MPEDVVLVTGAAGFIGSHLCEALIARGDTVVGLDNFDPTYPAALKRANLAALLAGPRFEFIEGDIRDEDALAGAFSHKPRAVVHLAAKGGVRASIADAEGYYDCNVRGTLRVLEAARQHGTERLVLGSSSSVYGVTNVLPFSEDQPTDRPMSPYAASKCAAEDLCHTWSHLYGLKVVCLRFFTVYGPRQRPDLAIRRFVDFVRQGEPIPRFGDGSSSRDYTYIADIVRGIVAALALDASFEVINLGNSSPVTLTELIELVGSACGVTPAIEQLPGQPGDMPHTFADISRAEELLGWRPEWSMADGLAEFVKWYDAKLS